MQLQIKSKLNIIDTIQTNHDEVKEFYIKKLEKYKNINYTDEQIQEAKKDRADLNKEAQAVQKFITNTKKDILKPFESFEANMKELKSLIFDTSQEIDGSIKAYEEKLKKEKQRLVEGCYKELIEDDWSAIITLERIFDEKWLNQSMNMKKVKEEMCGRIGFIKKDISVIRALKSPFEETLLKTYDIAEDITAVMEKKLELDEAAKTAEEKFKTEQEVKEKAPKEKIIDKILSEETEVKENEFQVVLRITANLGQLNALKEFMTINQLNWEKL